MGTVESQIATQVTDGFHLVIDALKLNGIDTIFGLPGIPITDFRRMAQAEGLRVISFRHEQNAGYAASIAGFLTQKPGICLTVSAPGFLNGLNALAHASVNCFPMILISGSSEREIVDLQQGDYEEMDQLAIAKPLAKAAFRVLHAEDIGVGIARAIRAAVSGRPGGVYLDLPAKLFSQTIDADLGKKSLIKVVDPAPKQIPAPEAVKRALDLLKGAKKPLVILGKGAAYAQADAEIRSFIEKTGLPYLPMSMAKGLLPDTHPQCASAARSFVLPEADVVMLVGARLNWLLSHGKGKTWGGTDHKAWGGQKFIQIDISPQEADSNVRIDAAVVSGQPVIAVEGDSAFGFSGMEVETICRYNLPVCVVVFNNNGVYRGTDVNPTGGPDVAPTVFVKNARYDKLIEAFGGVGVHATTPAELRKGMEEAIRSRKPTLINAVIDESAGTESGRITSLNPSAKKK